MSYIQNIEKEKADGIIEAFFRSRNSLRTLPDRMPGAGPVAQKAITELENLAEEIGISFERITPRGHRLTS